MTKFSVGVSVALLAGAVNVAAQSGDISGRVRQGWGRGLGVGSAHVTVVGTSYWAVTDYKGRYRIQAVPAGRYVVRVDADGYGSSVRGDVPVLSGAESGQDFLLVRDSATTAPPPQSDPRLLDMRDRLDREALSFLPVSSVPDAAGLWNAVVEDSYRGGRPGQQLTRLDGLEIRNWFDGSTDPSPLRVPLGLVEEISLVTDAAHLDGSPAGVLDIATRSADTNWRTVARYETDRPLSGSADQGLDRVMLQSGGPVFGRARVLAMLDATGRLQADPHNAALGDPGTPTPWDLAHNSGESIDGAAKLTLPMGERRTLDVLAVRSVDQRLVFDPVYKYDPTSGSAQRATATLLAAHLRHTSRAFQGTPVTTDLHLAFLTQTFTEGSLQSAVDYQFGALSTNAFHFWGEDAAHSLDTATARGAVIGYLPPAYSGNTPWGAPAFFLTGSRGDLLWHRSRELRAQFGMTAAPSRSLALSSDFGLSLRSVDAFQRVLAYLPVGASVPPATALSLAPLAINAGMGVERRAHNSVLTFGLRLDGTAPGGGSGGLRLGVSPRLGWALSLDAITLTTSLSRVSEFPDAQFLNDVAFDDTTTAGRFRRGDATLEDESALLGEIGVRMRTGRGTFAIRAFVKRFSGLVAADSLPADPDSSVLGNRDHGDVMGADVRLEQRFHRVAVSVSFALQTTSFQSAYGLRRSSAASPLDQDRPQRLAVVVRSPLPGAVDFATFARFESGRPYSPVGPTGQIIGGAPNGARLPSWFGIDVTLQRPFHAGSREGRLILDVRNILNRRNIIAVRRTTGTPGLSAAAIDSLAQAAYAAHPDPIPYDSPAYRAAADLDGNGLIEGSSELLPLFQAAARDYANPLMAYGPPRLFRLGLAFSL